MFSYNFIDPELAEKIENANNKFHEANADVFRLWVSDMVFSWQWWVVVALTVLPWVFWFIVRRKECSDRLLYAGFITMIMASYLDMTGMSIGLWSYNIRIFPMISSCMPWNFTMMPVAAMLFYQYKPRMNPIIKAVAFSTIGSFMIEPLFRWMGIYNPLKWKSYYSFPIYIIIYLIGNRMVKKNRFEKP